MIRVHIVDNLKKKTRDLTDDEAKKISELIRINTLQSERGEYSNEELEYLTKVKTPELIKKRAKNGLTVYLTNEKNEIIGCGMAAKMKKGYELKYLHIRQDYRKRGLARKICDIREDRLRAAGVKEVYISSLKFENTLRFHRLRGFKETGEKSSKGLSVLMKKKL